MKILQVKYQSPQIKTMTTEQVNLWSEALLLKIHVITGWVIPETGLLDILVDQFEKKLQEDYGDLNPDEIEYAFRKYGTTKIDWGKQMNLNLLDQVLIVYKQDRFEASQAEERSQKVYEHFTRERYLNERRKEIEEYYQRFRVGRIEPAEDFFFEILIADGLLKDGEDLFHFFGRMAGRSPNLYQKDE